MLKYLKVSLLFLVVSILFFSLRKIYEDKIDHFSLKRIQTYWQFSPFSSPPLSFEEKNYLQTVLNQPFYYLGKGNQCFAFESADHKFVLKFFNQKHLNHKKQLFYSQSRIEKNHLRKKKLYAIFKNAHFSFQELPQETGLLYLHLNVGAENWNRVRLVNRLGISQIANLSFIPFMLQRKVVTLPEYFKKNEHDEEKLSEAVASFLQAIEKRCKKRIRDSDDNVTANIGFDIETSQCLLIDFTSFVRDASLLQEEAIKREKIKRLGTLKEWAIKECSPLVPVLDHYTIELFNFRPMHLLKTNRTTKRASIPIIMLPAPIKINEGTFPTFITSFNPIIPNISVVPPTIPIKKRAIDSL